MRCLVVEHRSWCSNSVGDLLEWIRDIELTILFQIAASSTFIETDATPVRALVGKLTASHWGQLFLSLLAKQ